MKSTVHKNKMSQMQTFYRQGMNECPYIRHVNKVAMLTNSETQCKCVHKYRCMMLIVTGNWHDIMLSVDAQLRLGAMCAAYVSDSGGTMLHQFITNYSKKIFCMEGPMLYLLEYIDPNVTDSNGKTYIDMCCDLLTHNDANATTFFQVILKLITCSDLRPYNCSESNMQCLILTYNNMYNRNSILVKRSFIILSEIGRNSPCTAKVAAYFKHIRGKLCKDVQVLLFGEEDSFCSEVRLDYLNNAVIPLVKRIYVRHLSVGMRGTSHGVVIGNKKYMPWRISKIRNRSTTEWQELSTQVRDTEHSIQRLRSICKSVGIVVDETEGYDYESVVVDDVTYRYKVNKGTSRYMMRYLLTKHMNKSVSTVGCRSCCQCKKIYTNHTTLDGTDICKVDRSRCVDSTVCNSRYLLDLHEVKMMLDAGISYNPYTRTPMSRDIISAANALTIDSQPTSIHTHIDRLSIEQYQNRYSDKSLHEMYRSIIDDIRLESTWYEFTVSMTSMISYARMYFSVPPTVHSSGVNYYLLSKLKSSEYKYSLDMESY